jgi:hypothetical protein
LSVDFGALEETIELETLCADRRCRDEEPEVRGIADPG